MAVSISKYMFSLREGKYLKGVLDGITFENDSVSVCVSASLKERIKSALSYKPKTDNKSQRFHYSIMNLYTKLHGL